MGLSKDGFHRDNGSVFIPLALSPLLLVLQVICFFATRWLGPATIVFAAFFLWLGWRIRHYYSMLHPDGRLRPLFSVMLATPLVVIWGGWSSLPALGEATVAFLVLAILLATVTFVLATIFHGLFFGVVRASTAVQGAARMGHAVRLRPWLVERGYTWLTYEDAGYLYARLGEQAFHIPPVPDMAVLPGYVDEDVESIVFVMMAVNANRG